MDSKRLGLLYDPKISCETGFVVQVMPQMTAFGYSVLDLCFSVQRQTITHGHIYRQWEPYKSPRVLKILTIKIITLRAMKGKTCHLFFSQLDCCFDKSHKSTRASQTFRFSPPNPLPPHPPPTHIHFEICKMTSSFPLKAVWGEKQSKRNWIDLSPTITSGHWPSHTTAKVKIWICFWDLGKLQMLYL